MVFSSVLFLVYFLPFFVLVYSYVPQKFKNSAVLFFSIAFYLWGGVTFLPVLVFSITVDYFLVKWMEQYLTRRKLYAVIAVIFNIGLLAYFKYMDFFIGIVNASTHTNIPLLHITLPIGISFITFHKISYVMDIYFKKVPPLKKLSELLIYILLFPQLVAGPIIRFNEIAAQIINRSQNETPLHRLNGFYQFCFGLGRKVLLGNPMGFLADKIFALNANELDTPLAWLGALAYTFQIYFDFSGYSEMAIGLGRIAGFKFPENFNSPYIAIGITDFWRRWHITLGKFFKDYLYIPMGGNQQSSARTYLNLFTVFFVSGLWHGANATFVVWGLYHGIFIVIEKLASNFITHEWIKFRILKYSAVIVTFLIVLFGWVLFRADNLMQAQGFYLKMIKWTYIATTSQYLDLQSLSVLILCILFAFLPLRQSVTQWYENLFRQEPPGTFTSMAAIILYIFCLAEVMAATYNPFIYFRF